MSNKTPLPSLAAVLLTALLLCFVQRAVEGQIFERALGVQSGYVGNGNFWSNYWNGDSTCQPYMARLYGPAAHSWCVKGYGQALRVDMGLVLNITKVITQGRYIIPCHVKSFYLATSYDAGTWTWFTNPDGSNINFAANWESTALQTVPLPKKTETRFLWFQPTNWYAHYSSGGGLRLEIYGEPFASPPVPQRMCPGSNSGPIQMDLYFATANGLNVNITVSGDANDSVVNGLYFTFPPGSRYATFDVTSGYTLGAMQLNYSIWGADVNMYNNPYFTRTEVTVAVLRNITLPRVAYVATVSDASWVDVGCPLSTGTFTVALSLSGYAAGGTVVNPHPVSLVTKDFMKSFTFTPGPTVGPLNVSYTLGGSLAALYVTPPNDSLIVMANMSLPGLAATMNVWTWQNIVLDLVGVVPPGGDVTVDISIFGSAVTNWTWLNVSSLSFGAGDRKKTFNLTIGRTTGYVTMMFNISGSSAQFYNPPPLTNVTVISQWPGNPLGMEANTIPAALVTASSTDISNTLCSPTYGRLNRGSNQAWCAPPESIPGLDQEWLQINLTQPGVLWTVSTQGQANSQNWVTSFAVNYSMDCVNWNMIMDNGTRYIFPGNLDATTVVTNMLPLDTAGACFRIIPWTSNNNISMRVELLGAIMKPLALPAMLFTTSTSASITMDIGAPIRPNGQLKVNISFWGPAMNGSSHNPTPVLFSPGQQQLGVTITSGTALGALNMTYVLWGTSVNSYLACPSQSLMVKSQIITPSPAFVGTRTLSMPITFDLRYPVPGNASLGASIAISGMASPNSTVSTPLAYAEFEQQHGFTLLAGSLLGSITFTYSINDTTFFVVPPTSTITVFNPFAANAQMALGLQSAVLPDATMTALSYNTADASCRPWYGRLGSGNWWCSNTSNLVGKEYLQVSLPSSTYISAISTQGRPAGGSWTTTYKVQSSMDCVTFAPYVESAAEYVFPANTDATTVMTNTFASLLGGKCFRIYPMSWVGAVMGLRAELLGSLFYSPTLPTVLNVLSSSADVTIDLGAVVPVNGSVTVDISWFGSASSNAFVTPSNVTIAAGQRLGYFTIITGPNFGLFNLSYAVSGPSAANFTAPPTNYVTVKSFIVYPPIPDAMNISSTSNQISLDILTPVPAGGALTVTISLGGPAANKTSLSAYVFTFGPGDRVQNFTITTGRAAGALLLSYAISGLTAEWYVAPATQTIDVLYLFPGAAAGIGSFVATTPTVGDWAMTASSSDVANVKYKPFYGRLNNATGGWSTNGVSNEWLQVNLSSRVILKSVATQGYKGANQWVRSYRLATAGDCATWTFVQDPATGSDYIFSGPVDDNNVAMHALPTVQIARCVRFYPIEFTGRIAMRVEVFGAVTTPSMNLLGTISPTITLDLGTPVPPGGDLTVSVVLSGGISASCAATPSTLTFGAGQQVSTFSITTTAAAAGLVTVSFVYSGTSASLFDAPPSSVVLVQYAIPSPVLPASLGTASVAPPLNFDLGYPVPAGATLNVTVTLRGAAGATCSVSPNPITFTAGQQVKPYTITTGGILGSLRLLWSTAGTPYSYFAAPDASGLTILTSVKVTAPTYVFPLSTTVPSIAVLLGQGVLFGQTLVVSMTVYGSVAAEATLSSSTLTFNQGEKLKYFNVTAGSSIGSLVVVFDISGSASPLYLAPVNASLPVSSLMTVSGIPIILPMSTSSYSITVDLGMALAPGTDMNVSVAFSGSPGSTATYLPVPMMYTAGDRVKTFNMSTGLIPGELFTSLVNTGPAGPMFVPPAPTRTYVPSWNLPYAFFNGGGDKIQVPHSVMAMSPTITISAWMYWTGNRCWERSWDFGMDTGTFIFFAPRACGPSTCGVQLTRNGVGQTVLYGPNFPVNAWTHVVFTLDSSLLGTLYINNVVVGSTTFVSPTNFLTNGNGNVYWGKSQYNDPYYGGYMTEMNIFNVSLPPSGVAALYNLPPARIYKVGVLTANGTYAAGASIDIAVTFDRMVSLAAGASSPKIPLDLADGVTGYASYLSGSPSNVLIFRYTIAATDNSRRLNFKAGNLTLDGGTLKNSVNNLDVDLRLPNIGSNFALASQANIVIRNPVQSVATNWPVMMFSNHPSALVSLNLTVPMRVNNTMNVTANFTGAPGTGASVVPLIIGENTTDATVSIVPGPFVGMMNVSLVFSGLGAFWYNPPIMSPQVIVYSNVSLSFGRNALNVFTTYPLQVDLGAAVPAGMNVTVNLTLSGTGAPNVTVVESVFFDAGVRNLSVLLSTANVVGQLIISANVSGSGAVWFIDPTPLSLPVACLVTVPNHPLAMPVATTSAPITVDLGAVVPAGGMVTVSVAINGTGAGTTASISTLTFNPGQRSLTFTVTSSGVVGNWMFNYSLGGVSALNFIPPPPVTVTVYSVCPASTAANMYILTRPTVKIDLGSVVPPWGSVNVSVVMNTTAIGTTITLDNLYFGPGDKFKTFTVKPLGTVGTVGLSFVTTGPLASYYVPPPSVVVLVMAAVNPAVIPSSMPVNSVSSLFTLSLGAAPLPIGGSLNVSINLDGPAAAGAYTVPATAVYTVGGTTAQFTVYTSSAVGQLFISYSLQGSYATYYTVPPGAAVNVMGLMVSPVLPANILTSHTSVNVTMDLGAPVPEDGSVTIFFSVAGSSAPGASVSPSPLVFADGEQTLDFVVNTGPNPGTLKLTPSASGPSAAFFVSPAFSQTAVIVRPITLPLLPVSQLINSVSGDIGVNLALPVQSTLALNLAIAVSGVAGVTVSPSTINFVAGDQTANFTITTSGFVGTAVLTPSYSGSASGSYGLPILPPVNITSNIAAPTLPVTLDAYTTSTPVVMDLGALVPAGKTLRVQLVLSGYAATGSSINPPYLNFTAGTQTKSFNITAGWNVGDLVIDYVLSGSASSFFNAPTNQTISIVGSVPDIVVPSPVSTFSNAEFMLDLGFSIPTGLDLTVTMLLGSAVASSSIVTPYLLFEAGDRMQPFNVTLAEKVGTLAISFGVSGTAAPYFHSITAISFEVIALITADTPQKQEMNAVSGPVTLDIGTPVPVGGGLTVAISLSQMPDSGSYVSPSTFTFLPGEQQKTFTVTTSPSCLQIVFSYVVTGASASFYLPPAPGKLVTKGVVDFAPIRAACNSTTNVTVWMADMATLVSGNVKCQFANNIHPALEWNTTDMSITCAVPTGAGFSGRVLLSVSLDGTTFFPAGNFSFGGCVSMDSRCTNVRVGGFCSFNITINPPPTAAVLFTLTPPGSITLSQTVVYVNASRTTATVTFQAGGSLAPAAYIYFSAASSADPNYAGAVINPNRKSVQVVNTEYLYVDTAPLVSRVGGKIYLNVTANVVPSDDVMIPIIPAFNLAVISSNPAVISAGSQYTTIVLQGGIITNVDPTIWFQAAISGDGRFDSVQTDLVSKSIHLIISGAIAVKVQDLNFNTGVRLKSFTLIPSFPPTEPVYITATVPGFVEVVGGNNITLPASTAAPLVVYVNLTSDNTGSGNLTLFDAVSNDLSFNALPPDMSLIPVFATVCGDGIVMGMEQCDDNNTLNGDGCTTACQIQAGYVCYYDATLARSVCYTGCGDGFKAGSEECDDGNQIDGDGCSSTCVAQPGYVCVGGSPYTKDVCTACAPGSFNSNPALKFCSPCGSGTFAPNYGSTNCTPCPVGTYNPSQNSPVCFSCPAGYNSSIPGSLACSRCPFTQYQPLNGSSSCIDCPGNSFVQNIGAHITDCVCQENFFDSNIRANAVVKCKGCPVGAACAGGKAMPVPIAGYWSLNDSIDMFKCPHSVACPGGSSEKCAVGYTGSMCGRCALGYYLLSGICLACPASSSTPLILCIVALPLLCFFLYHFATSKYVTEDYWIVSLGSNISSCVAYTQVVATYSGFGVQWPDSVKEAMTFFTLFNFNIEWVKPDCVMSLSYTLRYATKVSMPLLFAILFIVLYLFTNFMANMGMFFRFPRDRYSKLKRKQQRRRPRLVDGKYNSWTKVQDGIHEGNSPTVMDEDEDDSPARQGWLDLLREPLEFNRMCNCLILTADFMCIFLLNASVELFQCLQQPDGTSTLINDPDMVCYSSEWYRILPIGLCSLVVYGLGQFALYIYIAIKAPANFHNPNWAQRFLCILCKYRKDNWYWCVITFLRKVCLSFIVTLLVSNPFVQSLLALLTSTLFLVLYTHYWPWVQWGTNLLDVLLLTCQIALTGLAFFFLDSHMVSQTDSKQVEVLANLTVAIISFGVLSAVWFAIYDFYAAWKYKSDSKKPDFSGLNTRGEKVVDAWNALMDNIADDPDIFKKWYMHAAAYERYTTMMTVNAMAGDLLGVKGPRKRLQKKRNAIYAGPRPNFAQEVLYDDNVIQEDPDYATEVPLKRASKEVRISRNASPTNKKGWKAFGKKPSPMARPKRIAVQPLDMALVNSRRKSCRYNIIDSERDAESVDPGTPSTGRHSFTSEHSETSPLTKGHSFNFLSSFAAAPGPYPSRGLVSRAPSLSSSSDGGPSENSLVAASDIVLEGSSPLPTPSRQGTPRTGSIRKSLLRSLSFSPRKNQVIPLQVEPEGPSTDRSGVSTPRSEEEYIMEL